MKNKDLNRKNNVQKNDIQKKISHEKCIFLLSFIMFALCLLSAVSFVIHMLPEYMHTALRKPVRKFWQRIF